MKIFKPQYAHCSSNFSQGVTWIKELFFAACVSVAQVHIWCDFSWVCYWFSWTLLHWFSSMTRLSDFLPDPQKHSISQFQLDFGGYRETKYTMAFLSSIKLFIVFVCCFRELKFTISLRDSPLVRILQLLLVILGLLQLLLLLPRDRAVVSILYGKSDLWVSIKQGKLK